jgi:hypothetical protein
MCEEYLQFMKMGDFILDAITLIVGDIPFEEYIERESKALDGGLKVSFFPPRGFSKAI